MHPQHTQFWNRITLLCAHCARPFTVVPSEAPRRTCCSISCSRAYKLSTWQERFWLRLHPGDSDNCWLWPGAILSSGYGVLRVNNKDLKAHRVAWELTNGVIPPGMYVLHHCDVRYPPGDKMYKRCCNPKHLFLGTHRENMADMCTKGRQARGDRSGVSLYPERVIRGENHSMAQLSNAQVHDIRALWESGGTSQSELARRYGVSYNQINRIVRRKSWTHI